jgi:peptidyl-prolyl cis-trans isomerase C
MLFARPLRRLAELIGMVFLVLTLAACGWSATPPRTESATATTAPVEATRTATPLPPSPTPQPLAARVNGEGVPLGLYQAELARYQAAVGTQLATEDEQRVLDELVDQYLLVQAAAEQGFTVDQETLQRRLDRLAEAMGGEQALETWMADYGYTDESLRQELKRAIAAAWMRDRIAEDVPESAEQVHARQILLTSPEAAQEAMSRLQSGQDFETLAQEYTPLGKIDLGWFPRGYLLDPQLEEAVFDLAPDEYSEVIQTSAGYHILQVVERDSNRALPADARRALQKQALKAWIDTRRDQSEIEILLP